MLFAGLVVRYPALLSSYAILGAVNNNASDGRAQHLLSHPGLPILKSAATLTRGAWKTHTSWLIGATMSLKLRDPSSITSNRDSA